MTRSPRPFAAALLLAFAAACAPDSGGTAGDAAPAEPSAADVAGSDEPRLTPADSAAAVAATQAHADSVTRAVRGQAGASGPYVETAEMRRAHCRQNAAQAEGVMREHILAACARMQ